MAADDSTTSPQLTVARQSFILNAGTRDAAPHPMK
jgi:hypothetical protein